MMRTSRTSRALVAEVRHPPLARHLVAVGDALLDLAAVCLQQVLGARCDGGHLERHELLGVAYGAVPRRPAPRRLDLGWAPTAPLHPGPRPSTHMPNPARRRLLIESIPLLGHPGKAEGTKGDAAYTAVSGSMPVWLGAPFSASTAAFRSLSHDDLCGLGDGPHAARCLGYAGAVQVCAERAHVRF